LTPAHSRRTRCGYRDACRKTGVECEFAGGRATNVTAAVRFLIEKVKGGIKVAIKGKPETEELLTDKALGESVNSAAFGFTDKHIGPKEKIGNKGGGLAVRLRAILAKKWPATTSPPQGSPGPSPGLLSWL
jgi:hypothetical protein